MQSEEPVGESHKTLTTLEVDKVNLFKMKEIYQEELEEYKLLIQVYNQERENARKQRRLRKFPSFESWIPEGRPLAVREQEFLAGPEPAASSILHYVF